MHSPISHCLVVTDTPDLCSCVSFNVPQIAQDGNPLLNLYFEVSASFHGKAGKLEIGSRVGGSRSGVYPGSRLSLLDPGSVHNSKPIVHGSTFLMFLCSLVSHVGFNRKRHGWHVLLFQCKGKVQKCALYLLDASHLRKWKVIQENYFLDSRFGRITLEKSKKKHLQTGKI